MVTAMDEAVAKVMTAMRKYKLTNNLLVVFTSDVSCPILYLHATARNLYSFRIVLPLMFFIEQRMMLLGKPFQHHNVVEAGPNICVFENFYRMFFNTASTNAVLSTNRGGMFHVSVAKTFSKFYRRYYDLISKFQVGLKSLLCQGLSKPDFYGDLVYKLKKIVGSNNFSALFIKILSHYKKIGYNINVLQQTACLVVNQITVGNFAFLFNCTPVGRTSDSMMVPT